MVVKSDVPMKAPDSGKAAFTRLNEDPGARGEFHSHSTIQPKQTSKTPCMKIIRDSEDIELESRKIRFLESRHHT